MAYFAKNLDEGVKEQVLTQMKELLESESTASLLYDTTVTERQKFSGVTYFLEQIFYSYDNAGKDRLA